MPMYNLTQYSNNYTKTSGSVWQYHKDDQYDNITDSESLKFKARITRRIPDAGNTKDVEIVVPLKYFSNFWRTLEMPLINCKINLMLTWSTNYDVIADSTGTEAFTITDTKLYIPVVILSTQGNAKLLKQLESGFTQKINWNK